MSTYIGTNFKLEGKEFLDQRQGLAVNKEDLKNWSIVVPEGFELCLGGSWYYYDSSITLPDTGHWIPRVSEEAKEGDLRAISSNAVHEVVKDVSEIRDDLIALDNSMYPVAITSLKVGTKYTDSTTLRNDKAIVTSTINSLISGEKYVAQLDLNGDNKINTVDLSLWNTLFDTLERNIPFTSAATSGTYWQELGSFMLPRITWKVCKPLVTWKISGSSVVWSVVPGSENNVVSVSSGSVVGETNGFFNTGFLGWTSAALLSSSTPRIFPYTITCRTQNGNEATETVNFRFGYKRYWGVGDLGIWNSNTLQGSSFSSAFTSGGTFPETAFNCTGGKYPYILIPKDYYSSSYNTYVSKNLNSDFLVKDVEVYNSVGIKLQYKLFRTNYIQTGNPINIEIK